MEQNRLECSSLKTYSHLDSLKDLTLHITHHLSYNQNFLHDMMVGFEETREALEFLSHSIDDKIKEEKVEKWLDSPSSYHGKLCG